MIDNDIFEAFNNRLVSVTEISKQSTTQLEKLKQMGSSAENLLRNHDFVLFVRQFQLETMDALNDITGYSLEDNAKRVALSNHFNAMDSFINLLKRQVVLKNRVVSLQEQKAQVDPNT